MGNFHQNNKEINTTGKEEEIKKLKEQLAEAMDNIEDEFSIQKIDELTEKLRSMESAEESLNMAEAKEEFFRDFLPLVEQNKEYDKHKYYTEKSSGSRKRLRLAIIIAAALLLINGVVIAVAGMNVFEALFHWNDTSFRITVTDEYEKDTELFDKNTIYVNENKSWFEMEKEFGTEIPVIGCFAEDMEVTNMERLLDNIIHIEFTSGGEEYLYSVEKLNQSNRKRIVEKTEEDPTIYSYQGIDYYFIPNERWITILWQYENQLYMFYLDDGDVEQAKTVVKSIQYEK